MLERRNTRSEIQRERSKWLNTLAMLFLLNTRMLNRLPRTPKEAVAIVAIPDVQ